MNVMHRINCESEMSNLSINRPQGLWTRKGEKNHADEVRM